MHNFEGIKKKKKLSMASLTLRTVLLPSTAVNAIPELVKGAPQRRNTKDTGHYSQRHGIRQYSKIEINYNTGIKTQLHNLKYGNFTNSSFYLMYSTISYNITTQPFKKKNKIKK